MAGRENLPGGKMGLESKSVDLSGLWKMSGMITDIMLRLVKN